MRRPEVGGNRRPAYLGTSMAREGENGKERWNLSLCNNVRDFRFISKGNREPWTAEHHPLRIIL
jgi:hypothetical protein